MKQRATLRTVAASVGVSAMTVSNAYSRPDQLSDELRARILSVAEDLGYPGPDPAARALRRGHVGSVGLVFTEALSYAFADPYAVAFLRGFAQGCEKADVGLELVPAPPGRSGSGRVRDAVVDGFCLFSLPDGHPSVRAAVRRGQPVVIVDQPWLDGAPFVGIDDRGAARIAAEHLIGLGHRRFAVIVDRLSHDGYRGPVDQARLSGATYRSARERLAGYREAIEAAALRWDRTRVLEAPPSSRTAGRSASGDLLGRPPRPTAILATTDALALGVLEGAREIGLDVPGDLSIVGFDDLPEAATNGLTTVHQPAADKGERAASLLLAGWDRAARVLLRPHLVVRQTTAPPAR
jgi:DNA-binding LacI/PurR family transcriptional regulator